jgi:hypothetical protein
VVEQKSPSPWLGNRAALLARGRRESTRDAATYFLSGYVDFEPARTTIRRGARGAGGGCSDAEERADFAVHEELPAKTGAKLTKEEGMSKVRVLVDTRKGALVLTSDENAN